MFKSFCKEVFAYENTTFSEWLREAIEIEERHIQQPLLIYHENKLISTFDVGKKNYHKKYSTKNVYNYCRKNYFMLWIPLYICIYSITIYRRL